jgi:hypothetical protein
MNYSCTSYSQLAERSVGIVMIPQMHHGSLQKFLSFSSMKWRNMNMLRFVLGVAVALVGAFVVFGIPQQALLNSLSPAVGTAVLLLGIVLLAILSGG